VLARTGSARIRELDRLDSITLLVGPEGGLAQEEQSAAIGRGFLSVQLGPRVLRTETAAVAALAALQQACGDF
jgi:16S rRNA (uracil1498-N3)-methyltransferase